MSLFNNKLPNKRERFSRIDKMIKQNYSQCFSSKLIEDLDLAIREVISSSRNNPDKMSQYDPKWYFNQFIKNNL
jgi:hypothetical protein